MGKIALLSQSKLVLQIREMIVYVTTIRTEFKLFNFDTLIYPEWTQMFAWNLCHCLGIIKTWIYRGGSSFYDNQSQG